MARFIQSVFLTLALLLPLIAAGNARADTPEPITLDATARGRTMEEATAALKQAIVNHNFTFVRQQAMDSRLVPYAQEVRSVRLVYFCNFAQMNQALKLDPRAAQMLPCRITLIETPTGVDLVAVNPAWVSRNFGNAALHEQCQQLKQDYLAILDEASL